MQFNLAKYAIPESPTNQMKQQKIEESLKRRAKSQQSYQSKIETRINSIQNRTNKYMNYKYIQDQETRPQKQRTIEYRRQYQYDVQVQNRLLTQRLNQIKSQLKHQNFLYHKKEDKKQNPQSVENIVKKSVYERVYSIQSQSKSQLIKSYNQTIDEVTKMLIEKNKNRVLLYKNALKIGGNPYLVQIYWENSILFITVSDFIDFKQIVIAKLKQKVGQLLISKFQMNYSKLAENIVSENGNFQLKEHNQDILEEIDQEIVNQKNQ